MLGARVRRPSLVDAAPAAHRPRRVLPRLAPAATTASRSSTRSDEHESSSMYTRVRARSIEWTTLAWALMRNHHHFVIQADGRRTVRGHARAASAGFSRWINAMYGQTRKGHLVRHAFFADEITSTTPISSRRASLRRTEPGRGEAPSPRPRTGLVRVRRDDRLALTRRASTTPKRLLASLRRHAAATARAAYARHVDENTFPSQDHDPSHQTSGSNVVRSRA